MRRKAGKAEREEMAKQNSCIQIIGKAISCTPKPVPKRKKRFISLKQHEQEMKIARLEAENDLLRKFAMDAKFVSVANYNVAARSDDPRVVNVNSGGTYVEKQNNINHK